MSLRRMLLMKAAVVGTDTDSLLMEYTRWVAMEGLERVCRIWMPAVVAGCISGVGSCTAGVLAGTAVAVVGMRLSRWSRFVPVGIEELAGRRRGLWRDRLRTS